jgi:DNA polymerase III gamma/tau subunit
MQTVLIGQDLNVNLLNKILDDPPHIFISGGYGCGKTTLLREFISAYFKVNNVKPSYESILWLSSEQDRGIHCIRQSVAEFVKHTSNTPNVYRWIIIDDADSLPIISQQALRRPMETNAHSTRFIFCSRYKSDLIQPILSRCMHLEINVVPPSQLVEHFIKKYSTRKITFSSDFIEILLTIVCVPTEIRNCIRILINYYKDKSEYTLTKNDMLKLFSAPSFTLCHQLLLSYINGESNEVVRIFLDIWKTGLSYEDFLHELNASFQLIKFIPPTVSQEIHELLIKGWINFAQGKTHTLDMMRLFLGSNDK